MRPGTFPAFLRLQRLWLLRGEFWRRFRRSGGHGGAGFGFEVRAGLDIGEEDILYTITATNVGDGDAKSATVAAAYPDGMAFGGSPDCTESAGSRNLTCSVGALPSSASTTLTFTAHPDLLNLGTLAATAQLVRTVPADTNPANDTASRSCTAITGLIISY